ncbi:MAG: TonB-dependent hemoglobin/transferrin/lactoferrin family receptor [Hyphomicrobiaceae bacterium]
MRTVLKSSAPAGVGRSLKAMLLGSAAVALVFSPAGGGSQQARAQTAAAQKAQGQSASYRIPPQSLGSALTSFADRAGLKLLFPSSIVAGKTTPGLAGSFSRRQALSRLLSGTGLTYSFTSANTVTIIDPNAGGNNATATVDGAIALDTIDVSGGANAASGSGYQGTPDWVYQTPSSVSVISREAIENAPARNTRDLLDNVAGVYANRSEAQNPGITINIRGLQDQGRINTMIDGARQDFQRAGHGSSQLTYVDTAFIRQVDIEKSTTSGVGSAAALGGLVNFRTIEADDLIKPGQKFGGQVNLTKGTNAYNFEGSMAAAARFSDSFSLLAGISRKDIGAFDIGKHGDLKLSSGTTQNGLLLFSGQEVASGIVKAEAKLNDDMKLTLGWLRNRSQFSTGGNSSLQGLIQSDENLVNDTFTSAFDWNPDSNLINVKARFYYNHIKDNLVSDGGLLFRGTKIPIDYTMGTLGGSIENTSRFDTALGSLSFNYGAEAFQDDGQGKVGTSLTGVDGSDWSSSYVGSTGSGKRTVASGFGSAKWDPTNWLSISGGIRYDYYNISGSSAIYGSKTHDVIGTINHPGTPPSCWPSPPFPPNFNCTPGTPPSTENVYGPDYYPQYNADVDRSGDSFLPTFTVAVKPFDWLQPFVKYSKSFRPPTIMESFFTSGHDSINGYAPNPDLKPERGDTWELGANISRDHIFTDRDTFRLKVVGFYREIEDYITIGSHYRPETDRYYQSFVNLYGVTRMKGVEVEGNYDARAFYIGGSFTFNDTKWAERFVVNGPFGGLGSLNGAGVPVLFVQPRFRVVIDGGVRLLDEKLTLGGRIAHVTPTEPTLGSLLPASTFGSDAYTVYDLYGSYAFTDDVKLRFAVNNLTDLHYVPAGGYFTAPGRTATTSLNLKF